MRKVLMSVACLLSGLAQAQNVELNEVMITASRDGQSSLETGRSIEIISSELIQSMPVNSVDELLRFVTGVNLNSRGGFGVQTDIGMRGSTFSQVLVLVDNVRLNDALTGHFNSNIPVPISDIHHIEITRGPSAATFGADAVGGVINIITHTYAAENPDNELQISGDVGAGENELRATDIGALVTQQKLTVSASARTIAAYGEEFANPNFEQGVSEDSLSNSDFDLRTYSAAASYRFNPNLRAYARVGYDDRDFDAQYFYTRSAYDESRESTSNLWTQASIQYQNGKHSVELIGAYKELEDVFAFNPLFAANEHKTTQINSSLIHSFNHEQFKLTYGGQLISRSVESTDRGEHDDMSGGVFAMLSRTFIDQLNVNLSARAEFDEIFGQEIIPQASVSYRVKNLVLRSSYGRSIRAADYTERFVSYNIPELTPGRNAGNPDLLAETSNTFDIGLDWFAKEGLKFSTTGFVRQSSNLIDFALTNADEIENLNNLSPGEDYFYANNVSESQVIGLEAQIDYKTILFNSLDVMTSLGYTYLETSTDAGTLSKYISNHPRSNTNFSLMLRYGRLAFTGNANYVVRQAEIAEAVAAEIPGEYLICNAKVALNLVDELAIYARVNNLLDTQYQEVLGARMPGRWMSAGVKWNIVHP